MRTQSPNAIGQVVLVHEFRMFPGDKQYLAKTLRSKMPRFGDETRPPDPGDATAADMLDAALESMTVLLDKMESMRVRGRAAVGSEANQPQLGRFKRALIEASERHRSVGRMRVAYWRIRHRGRQLVAPVRAGTRK